MSPPTDPVAVADRSHGPTASASRSPLASRVLVLVGVLLIAMVASIVIGAETPSPWRIPSALLAGGQDGATAWTLVLDYRVPRTLVGVVVGVALGVAGALMQAYTRNPMADPGLLGVSSGAMFATVVAIAVGWSATTASLVWPSMVGALASVLVLLLLASTGRGPATPIRMTLAGVALAAALEGTTTAIRLSSPEVFERFRSWAVGSIAGRGIPDVAVVVPAVIIGLVLAALLVKPLNAVALGDDMASALGTDVGRVRLATVAAVALLVGAATAIAGPIGFVGLMVPHAVRLLVGNDQTRIIPLSALAAPCLLLAADTLARVIVPAQEAPVGVVTAFLGAPLLVWLIRSRQVNTQ